MNGDVSEGYFEQMIELISKNAVSLMENAIYYSTFVENLTATQCRKNATWIFFMKLIFNDNDIMADAEISAIANIHK